MLSDLLHAVRSLAKSPGFTVVALLTLALGIGVNTAMFSLLDTLVFHEPPYPEPTALLRVFRTGPTVGFGPHAPANFLDLEAQNKSFSHLAAFVRNAANFAAPAQPVEQVPVMSVSGQFFAALGVPPALGRTITDDDNRPGPGNVIVLSDSFWRQRFAADASIVGQTIPLDGVPVTVVGVMPAGFDDRLLWGPVAGWRPFAFDAKTRADRGSNYLAVFGRLQAGVGPAQALAEMNALGSALARAFPETNAKTTFTLVPFVRSMQDNGARTLSLFALGLAGCVLLIACVNLANLLFARNVARARHHAIRAALGASRGRLLRQALAESFALALGGGGFGLLLALWGSALLGSRLFVGGQPLALLVDWRVASFAFAAAFLATVGSALLPALTASRVDLVHALQQGNRGTASAAHQRIRRSLVVAEVALALLLLSGAGFFVRGLDRFLARDQGWRTAGLLTAGLSLPDARYGRDEQKAAFYERLQIRLAALPGVRHVALSRTLPFFGFGYNQRFIVEGRPAPPSGSEPLRDVNGVSPDYFETMGIPLLEGRALTAADLTGPVRTVISESMARQLWPGQSALGKRFAHPVAKEWQEVVGVVRDVRFASNLDDTGGRFQTYRLLAREPAADISLALRCDVPPENLIAPLRRAVADLDPELPVTGIRSARQVVEQDTANYALTGGLLTAFALLGLLLAAIGVYGVVAGFVAERTNEIGIRIALGAQLPDVLRLVLGQGLRLALAGSALGLAGAWAVARLLSSLLPALPPSEPLLATGLALTLLAIAIVASWLPARRAAKVDPLIALRAE